MEAATHGTPSNGDCAHPELTCAASAASSISIRRAVGGAALSQYPGRPADTGMGRAAPAGRLPHGGEGMRDRKRPMSFQRLTILMPAYNEARTIREILLQVDAADAAGLEKDFIIVDDGSTDGTREMLAASRRAQDARPRPVPRAEHGERGRASNRPDLRHRRNHPHPGRRSGVRSEGVHRASGTHPDGSGRCGVRFSSAGREARSGISA